MTTDVLIVGAGPTGLMLANQLGRRGVQAMIVDRFDEADMRLWFADHQVHPAAPHGRVGQRLAS
jgi:2-polyprenyl-6-methoxyphenol hydroxylase-like FAD-dependent oxidoreductase